MIQPAALLNDAKKLVKQLVADIDTRLREQADEEAVLARQHGSAVQQGRTGANYTDWRFERITQAAVAWVLACTFVRFLEDNNLLTERKLADPDNHQRAEDHLRAYFRQNPQGHERHYLLDVFTQVEALPAAAPLFDRAHNPLFSLPLSGDGAKTLLAFWRARHQESGELKHNFSDETWNTRFLGDLYQDLSEDIRKKYALLQTPEFVEEFILDHTLTPAVTTFGYDKVRLIDPTCGSGHFLLGAFQRLVDLYREHEPTKDRFAVAQAALAAVHGVDLNPYAVSIARFRLVIAALRICGVTRIAQAPMFSVKLAAGDSLLHGKSVHENRGRQVEIFSDDDPYKHVYEVEDRETLKQILDQTYHVVVGNPPYIVCRDPALNQAYRDRYESTHRQYSLGVPFTERFFLLAMDGFQSKTPGYVGLITANSFMKREFGTKLIKEYLPRIELTHVIDTSGAYIPGHGTPTVILFGRNRMISAETRSMHPVRAVLGIRGEPSTPEDPAQGKVWSSIVTLIREKEAENDFVSVLDKLQPDFHNHPWSLSGGGNLELKQLLEKESKPITTAIDLIGFICMTRADDIYFTPRAALLRYGIEQRFIVENVEGTVVRDWVIREPNTTIFPYDENLDPINEDDGKRVHQFLWPYRCLLWLRREPNGNHKEIGKTWFEWSRFQKERFLSPLSITFAFVATHNHFVLDRGGKVFNRSAPVIKLPETATEEDHLQLLGLLNSSTACFWMKQVFADKGNGGIGGGISDEMWERRFEFDGTKLKRCPIPKDLPLQLSKKLDRLSAQMSDAVQLFSESVPSQSILKEWQNQHTILFKQMVFLQEELDWQTYYLYGLTQDKLISPEGEVIPLKPGERAFEIYLARKAAAGELKTVWFERHGTIPVTEFPSHWPSSYQELVERRLRVIASKKEIRLIEKPDFKRRWAQQPFDKKAATALKNWLVNYLENLPCWQNAELQTVGHLADELRTDKDFMDVLKLYSERSDFDLAIELEKLTAGESVPVQSACCYKDKGLDNYAAWCETWDKQRAEDAIDARTTLPADHGQHLSTEAAAALKKQEIGDIPVPPKYKPAEFLNPSYFKLRGKLDVPKERFISFPHCERDGDPTPVIGWAGWNHQQRTRAIVDYYLDRKDNNGWNAQRLTPLLVAIAELLPWVKQWHNDIDPEHGVRLGDEYAGFLAEELRDSGLTQQDLSAWRPPQKTRKTIRSPKA